MRPRRGAAALVAAALVGVLACAGAADASQLGLVSRSIRTFALARCGAGPLTVAPTGVTSSPASTTTTAQATGISVAGADAACAGQPATVTLYRRTTGVVVASGTGTVAAGGTVTAPPAAAYAASGDLAARVTLGGWAVPSVWAPPVSCVAVNDPTRTCEVRWTVTTGTVNLVFWSYPYYKIAYTVSSPSTTATTQWRVTFDLSTFATWLPARVRKLDAAVTTPAACVTLPTLQLQGGAAVGGGTTFSGSVQMDRSVIFDVYDAYPLC
ncbi:hypothetical protein Cch01nite_32920 [Cellulomonas chitinilytica]|uniref:CBM2 domain-containing protein n=1 Tax=Cellulomonas chitinilytica TaxID=398759 RepID=A0A919U104_9CELL|nr:hypothetical protein [Cellulomonas chitinilytica]GIG22568.1 hypothetical protein Cch01nite_32920 [Cellulomonas chitinilytica]